MEKQQPKKSVNYSRNVPFYEKLTETSNVYFLIMFFKVYVTPNQKIWPAHSPYRFELSKIEK